MKEVAAIRRGITTGCNEFFFLEQTSQKAPRGLVHVTNGDGWAGILEEQVLVSAVQRAGECDRPIFRPRRLLFCAGEMPPEHAYSYIRHGETMGYHQRATCRARRRWWELPIESPQKELIAFNYNIYDTGRSYVSRVSPTYYSDSFHVLLADNLKCLHAYMCSTLFHFFVNVDARTVFGGGKAKLQTYELADLLCPSHLVAIEEDATFHGTYELLCRSSEAPVLQSLSSPTHLTLDNMIFDLVGLTQSERSSVYDALAELVGSRLAKADSL